MRRYVTRSIAVLVSMMLVVLALAGCVAQPARSEGSEPGSGSEAAGTRFVIIHTNDIHGYIQHGEDCLGIAAVAQLKADYREAGYETILVDAGDWLQGNLVIDDSDGDKAVDFMNAAGYDVMSPGNHEFDYGSDVLEERAARLECPFVSANILVDATGERLFEPNAIITLSDGTKVGFFGLDTPETKTKSAPTNTLGLTFLAGEELYACAQEQIDELESQGCDIIVCLGHLGEEDGSAPNRARDVVEHTSGLDLFIDAHDHKVESELIADKDGNDVLVVETGSCLSNIGAVEYTDGIPNAILHTHEEYSAFDRSIDGDASALAAEIDEHMSSVVGTLSFPLNGEREDVRTCETNLGDFVADAVLWQATQAAPTTPDAAIVNGGSIRTSAAPGDITLRIIHDISPFTNHIVTIEVTGAQLLEALEAATSGAPDQMGAFPQVSGITYVLDTTIPYENGEQYPDSTYFAPANPGARVTITDVGGRGFSLEDTYVIAIADFLAEGGDTYYAFAEAAQYSFQSTGYYVYQGIQYYIEEQGGTIPEAYREPQGRITVIVD